MSRPSFDLKLDWAYKHLERAEAAIERYLSPGNKAYEVTPDKEGEPAKLAFWLTLLKEPPDCISLMAGDCIHNARTSLDHIVYAISSKRKPNPGDTSFPIQSEPADWDRRIQGSTLAKGSGKYQVRLLPCRARTIIKNQQPWKGLDQLHPERGRLKALRGMDIADKHKKLNLAVAYLDATGYGAFSEEFLPWHDTMNRGPLQLNTPILALRFDPIPKMQMHPKPKLAVTFSEGGTGDEPVVGKLSELLGCVERILTELRRFV